MLKAKTKTAFINSRPYELEPFLTKVQACCAWLNEEIGFRLNGRISAYIDEFKKLHRLRGNLNDELYYALQALHEMHQVIQVHEHLQRDQSDKFVLAVKKACKGAAFLNQPDISQTDQARNHLFELLIACDYAAVNHKIDLTQRADIVLHEEKLIVECKRVNSISSLFERLKKAVKQIEDDTSSWPGIIYIDITEVIEDAHSVLTLNETGPLGSFMAIRGDEESKAFFEDSVVNKIRPFIEELIVARIKLMSEKVLGVVFVVNSVGFQASFLYERVVAMQTKLLIRNPRSPREICGVVKAW